jgi:hypothetical protein
MKDKLYACFEYKELGNRLASNRLPKICSFALSTLFFNFTSPTLSSTLNALFNLRSQHALIHYLRCRRRFPSRHHRSNYRSLLVRSTRALSHSELRY